MNKILELFEKRYKIIFVIMIFIISAICLVNLGDFAVQDWDEARHGVNAYEMYKNKEYIITTYNYQNDYWNLKPPLSPLIINLFFNLFGKSIFTFRLYSAISIILLAIIIGLFMKDRYGKVESIVALILFAICKPIFLRHVGRYGDADGLFLLLSSISLLSMFYIKENKKYLYISGFFFSLAFLTKSWHALFIVAIGGLYLLLSGEIKKIKFKQYILFIASFVIPIGSWILLRVKKDGFKFLQEMVKYDLLKRTSTGIEGNGQDCLFYIKHMIVEFSISSLIIILLLILIKDYKKILNKSNLPYLLWIIVPFVLFTVSKTKLDWYIVPIYVPIILLSTTIIVSLFRNENRIFSKTIFLILIVSIIINGTMLTKTIMNPDNNNVQDFIRQISNEENVQSRNTYISIDTDKWSQSQLFVLELYLDGKSQDGGVEGFINDNSNSLLIVKDDMYKADETLKNYKKICEDNGLVALTK